MSNMLGNALSGLNAAQTVLNVTSQNVANANTPGYSRQDATLASRADGSPSRLSAGNGVEVSDIRRIADEFRTSALWRAGSQSGYDGQMRTLVEQAEDIIGGDELSLSAGIDTLFAAFNAAAEAPQSMATRQQILASADALANRFNQLAGTLDMQERMISEQMSAQVDTVNSQLGNVARLNQRIADVQAQGGNTAQLQDQRDLAIKELSGHLDLRTQTFPDGRINVTLAAGEPLVLGDRASSLSLDGDELSLAFKGQSFPVTRAGGELGALQDYRQGTLADIRGRLNDQAENLAQSINDQLEAGFDLDGNPGTALYQFDPAAPAGSIRVADIDPEQLAFRGDNGSGAPLGGQGDNTNLLAVVDMKSGFYDDYTALVGDIGIESAQVQASASASRALVEDAQQRRDSVSGVNQDEEAVRLMEFMQHYQANAKVISTADQTFNTLLGMF